MNQGGNGRPGRIAQLAAKTRPPATAKASLPRNCWTWVESAVLARGLRPHNRRDERQHAERESGEMGHSLCSWTRGAKLRQRTEIANGGPITRGRRQKKRLRSRNRESGAPESFEEPPHGDAEAGQDVRAGQLVVAGEDAGAVVVEDVDLLGRVIGHADDADAGLTVLADLDADLRPAVAGRADFED